MQFYFVFFVTFGKAQDRLRGEMLFLGYVEKDVLCTLFLEFSLLVMRWGFYRWLFLKIEFFIGFNLLSKIIIRLHQCIQFGCY